MLKYIKIKRSTFYTARKNVTDKYAEIKEKIKKIYENNITYGYRMIYGIIKDLDNGKYKVGVNTVLKLMREMGLKSVIRAKRYSSYQKAKKFEAPNRLQRDFNAAKPNKKWSTDITEFKAFGTKLYLSAIKDLCTKEIIAYKIGCHPTLKLVIDTVKEAIKNRQCQRVILHSDQGWHYKHEEYRALLKKAKIRQSMSRKGNCIDNSPIENFWGILKTEWLYMTKFKTFQELFDSLDKYILYYNNNRKIAKLGYCSPIYYRKLLSA